MTGRLMLLPSWLRSRRVAFGVLRVLLSALLVAGIAVALTLAGIHIVGSIDGWQRWLHEHSVHFFVWRVFLYAATGCGWWWMRKRLLQREAAAETHQRLLRVELAIVAALVLLEGSQLLHDG